MAQLMGDFDRPTFSSITSAIFLTTEVRNYELKSYHHSLLPSYHGLPNENALAFIREYCAIVETFPLRAITDDQLKMKCFLYTLKGRARKWYLSLPANSLTTWEAVWNKFMLKYYPYSKTKEIRAKILNFAQAEDESFHEAWDRFQDLLQQCPHHHIIPEMLWQCFYNGLHDTCENMVDIAAVGDIGVKTTTELKGIFEKLAESSEQNSFRPSKTEASAVTTSPNLKKQMADMMKKLQELKMNKPVSPPIQESELEPCGICGEFGHVVDACTRMSELTNERGAKAYAARGYPHQVQPQQNSGWKNKQNMGWKTQNQGQGSRPNFQSFQNRRPLPFAQQFPLQQPFNPPQQPYYPPQSQFYPHPQQALFPNTATTI